MLLSKGSMDIFINCGCFERAFINVPFQSMISLPLFYNFTSWFGFKQMFVIVLILVPTFIISGISQTLIEFPGFILLGIPVLLMMAMNEIDILRKHWFEIMGIYTSVLDLFTHLLVAKQYLDSNNILWGIIQICLSSGTHIISCIDMYSIGIVSSLLTLLGLGRPLIVIQTWFYPEYSSKLSSMKSWELFYESLPSFSFQLYTLFIRLHDNDNSLNKTIIPSIVAVMMNASLTMWLYVVSKTDESRIELLIEQSTIRVDHSLQYAILSQEQNISISDQSITDKTMLTSNSYSENVILNKSNFMEDIDIPYQHVCHNCAFFSILLIHLFGDFISRVYPLINIFITIHIIHKTQNNKIYYILYIIPIIIIILILIYSYKMSLNIKRNKSFIIKIFFVLLYSSFYNMLCTIKSLKYDKWFGYTLNYNNYKKEFNYRLIISLILYIISLIWYYMYIIMSSECNIKSTPLLMIIFNGMYIPILFVSKMTSYYFERYSTKDFLSKSVN